MIKQLIGALALGAALPLTAQPAPQTPITDGRPIEAGRSHTLTSRIMGDDREVNIWLPLGYARTQQRYPVVYLLDGAVSQDFPHIVGLAQLASLSWTFGPMILVGVQTKTRIAELTEPPTDPRYRSAFPNSGDAPRFRRFLAEEVIPFVEQRYRTSERRALMGESLAGLFVVDTLLTQPALFQDYIAVSPSLWWDDRRPMRNLAATLPRRDLSGRRLYLAVGNEGGTGQDGVDMLRAALARQAPRDFALKYSDRSAIATHATIFHGAAEEALRWLYPAPPDESVQAPWYMIEGASPPPAPAAGQR